jgi:large subunit ribosomal protein L9
MATAINVILTEDSTAGKAGELVKVRLGYARNFLLPKGLAVVADVFNMQKYEDQKAELEKQAAERKEASEAAKDQIGEDAVVTVSSKAGESGKLFGAITKEKIAEAISEQLKVPVAKTSISIPNPIKALGQHKAKVDLGSNISTEVIIKVENEN